MAKRFTTERVIAEIRSISPTEEEYRTTVLTATAGALLRFGGVLGQEFIESMPRRRRDVAYAEECDYLLYHKASHDPYQRNSGDPFLLSYSEALNIVKIMEKMEVDSIIYSVLNQFVDGITSKRSWERLTLEQRVDLGRRLDRIAESKFPDPRNIRHNGYRIATRAEIERIRQSGGDSWQKLLSEARLVPNDADRALVLCIVTEALPSRLSGMRDSLWSEIRSVIDAIPAEYDRRSRLLSLAEAAKGSDSGLCRSALSAAMATLSRSSGGIEAEALQRRVLDLAHRIDPSFAASLAAMVDDDPARARMRAEAHDRVTVLDMKQGMITGASRGDRSSKERHHLAEAVWMTLGSLIAGRIDTQHTDEMKEYLKDAAALPLPEGYPILAWIIENAIRRVGRSDSAGKTLVPMFEGSIRAAELAERIASRWCKRNVALPSGEVLEDGSSTIVRKGERGKAVTFIADWCEHYVGEYLIICDPYFRPDDLEAVMIAKRAGVGCRIWVVTSRLAHKVITASWEDEYRQAWARSYDQPPDVDVTIVGGENSGKMPIHDRWWLTRRSGLRCGSSFNALGLEKTCEISIMSEQEAGAAEKEVRRLIGREVRVSEGERVQYSGFTL